jgi:hypothetical protein
MARPNRFTIQPEDKRNVTVSLKLTEHENDLLARYAAQLESDKSYVAGKIFEAFIPQALTPEKAALNGNGTHPKRQDTTKKAAEAKTAEAIA